VNDYKIGLRPCVTQLAVAIRSEASVDVDTSSCLDSLAGFYLAKEVEDGCKTRKGWSEAGRFGDRVKCKVTFVRGVTQGKKHHPSGNFVH